jgi:hypothetical protein
MADYVCNFRDLLPWTRKPEPRRLRMLSARCADMPNGCIVRRHIEVHRLVGWFDFRGRLGRAQPPAGQKGEPWQTNGASSRVNSKLRRFGG